MTLPKAPRKTYNKHYSEKKFWAKIPEALQSAGREVIEKSLILYYVGIDPKTPTWAKAIIGTALGYFIFPIDAIPDFTPVAGYADDLGAIVAAVASIGACITRKHIALAKKKMKELFG
jgi:uncharacterized membrane protein YkvA (DUF1232 family)